MRFYDETKPLYPEINASGVGMGASLLKTKSSSSCPRDAEQGNSILKPIAFVSKSISSAEKRYSNIEREALGILLGLKKFCHCCFTKEVRSQAVSCNIQERCSNIMTKTTANPPQNTPIQSQNIEQTWPRSLHIRLALQTRP